MTNLITARPAATLIDGHLQSTAGVFESTTTKRVVLIVAVVLAGLGLADVLGFGAAIAEAGLPPKTPTGTGWPD
jgi:ABC-type tungstate transport system substrate-binding protein